MNHNFNFIGGEKLRHIGATWLVSYCYYLNQDCKHKEWQLVKTFKYRIRLYENTKQYHRDWLWEVVQMNDKNLARNKIQIKPTKVKKMAKILLQLPNLI